VVVGVVRKYSNASTRYNKGSKWWARIPHPIHCSP
jgi:oligoendopeptidase F